MANCFNEISGLQRISLYLNSGIQLIRPDISNENEVNLITDGESSFTISEVIALPKWERIVGYSGNYKQNYLDEFTFIVSGIENEIPSIIQDLRNNRVGYIAEIVTTGNINYIFPSPVFLNKANTKQINSHSWIVSLSYRIPTFEDKLILLETTLSTDLLTIESNIEVQGVQRMSLYINNDVVYRYLDTSNENEIALVSPVEPFITINNINQLPKWERTIDNSDNYKQNYIDEFSFLLHGIENDVPEIIQSLRNNRVGFIAEILTTGNKPFIFRTPVFLNEDNTKQIDSHSWEVSLSYRTPSFQDKLTLTERPLVEYRNGIVTNSFFGGVAVFDFEAKINSDTQVTFTINWGAEVGTTVINSIMVNGVWKALQTSILIPEGVDSNQTITVTDNFGDSFEVGYTVTLNIPAGAFLRWNGGSISDISGSANVYDGTLNGATDPTLVNGINGVANTAWKIDSANNQFVSTGNISEIVSVTALSYSIWMRKAAGDDFIISSLITGLTLGEFLRWFTDNKMYYAVRGDGGANNIKFHDVSAELDVWTHFVGVYDASQPTDALKLTLYVNTVSVGTISAPPVPPTSTDKVRGFQIGSFLGANFGDGEFGPLTMYDRVLNQADVDLLFTEKTV